MSPIPRIARVPLMAKQPEACPHCGGHNLTRRGTRRKKLEIVQLWRCTSCKRVFTPGPAALQNKTYPLRMILSALTDYDTGYTLEETAARLKKKAHRSVSPSTITTWLDEYKQHCSYRRLRAEGLKRFPANQTIRSIKLYHRQIYGYAFHRPKLESLRAGTLDDKRPGDTRFAPLADFLESIPTTCPHDLFRRDDDPKARASQATPSWADVSRIAAGQPKAPGAVRGGVRAETVKTIRVASGELFSTGLWIEGANLVCDLAYDSAAVTRGETTVWQHQARSRRSP